MLNHICKKNILELIKYSRRKSISVLIVWCFINSFFAQKADSLYKLGREQFEIGNYNKAVGYFKETSQLQKNYKGLYYLSGMAHYNLKQYKKAINYFQKDIKETSSNINSYLYTSISYQKLKKHKQALSSIKLAIYKDSLNPLVIIEEGNIYTDLKKYELAKQRYLKALQLKPNWELAFYKMGFCFYNLNDLNNACFYWKKIQDIDEFENYEIILKTCQIQ